MFYIVPSRNNIPVRKGKEISCVIVVTLQSIVLIEFKILLRTYFLDDPFGKYLLREVRNLAL